MSHFAYLHNAFFSPFTVISWHKWHSHRDPNSSIYRLVIENDTEKSLNFVDMLKEIWLMNSYFYVFARECIHSWGHWWPRVLVANKASSDGPWRARFMLVEPLTLINLFSMHHSLRTRATTNKSVLNVSPHRALLHKRPKCCLLSLITSTLATVRLQWVYSDWNMTLDSVKTFLKPMLAIPKWVVEDILKFSDVVAAVSLC